MKLADRIAAWFGYQPVRPVRSFDWTMTYGEEAMRSMVMTEGEYVRWISGQLAVVSEPPTKSVSQILVASDFKRGIPCS